MKKRIIYLSILIFPFLGMTTVNEFVRLHTKVEGYNRQGIIAINPVKKLKERCSWACHNDTNHCKEEHVKLANPYFDKIDPIYFGIINTLKSTGNYGLANIIFLVILLPLLLFLLLVKSVNMQLEINKIKNE